MIPYGRQEITQDDIDAVVEVMRSDFITQGPMVPKFEQAVADYCGAQYAVAVSSGTAALHTACLAMDLGPGDWLWTSPITFVASANCGLYCGAQVDFVDVDPRTHNISVAALAAKLEHSESRGVLPKVVVPVHFAGQSCDMREIHALADQYGFRVLEDASHGLGGRYLDAQVGSCRYSDAAVFSFHPVKSITTGEGGMIVTNDERLAETARRMRTHGITRDPTSMVNESSGPWYYEQIALGFNYRITDIQAALGISQLQRLDSYVAKRHEIAECYDAALHALPLELPHRLEGVYSSMHLYVVRLNSRQIKQSHKEVFEALRERGVGVNLHYIPVPSQPFYRALGFSLEDYPNAARYYGEALTLPMYPTLTEEHQETVVTELRRILV